MEFIEAMKIIARMCDIEHCLNCPLSDDNNGTKESCCDFTIQFPKKAEKILTKWAEEHPQKTILTDFLEKYPNAPLNESGFPKVCPVGLGFYDSGCPFVGGVVDCKKCWNRPMEE